VEKLGKQSLRRVRRQLMSLADACVEVNVAAEKTIQGATGMANPDSLEAFALELDGIAERTDARGSDAVADLATRSRTVSETLATSTEPLDRLEAGTDMLNGYKRLQNSCQAVGSPLSVPGRG
jgi:hypothetical protein